LSIPARGEMTQAAAKWRAKVLKLKFFKNFVLM